MNRINTADRENRSTSRSRGNSRSNSRVGTQGQEQEKQYIEGEKILRMGTPGSRSLQGRVNLSAHREKRMKELG